MHLQFKFLAIAVILAIIAMWLEGCNFAVVESAPVEISWAGTALAEEADGFIARGSRDAAGETAVKDLQAQLVQLGYLNEAPDGVFGKNTEGALLHFQEVNRLDVSGVLDRATERRLFSAKAMPVPAPDPVDLDRGDSGDQVLFVQQRLCRYGFMPDAPNGSFDRSFEKYVMAFQDYAVTYYGRNFDLPGTAAVPTPGNTAEKDYAGYGDVSVRLYRYLEEELFPIYRENVGTGDSGPEVLRVQNRLAALGYLFDHEPGVCDEYTRAAIYWFQGRNNLEKTGVADRITQSKLFSGSAVAPDAVEHPFFMRVSLDEQKVYVYRWVCGDYNLHVKTMICSTGKPGWETPKGLFHSSGHAGDRWHHFEMNDTYAQYAFNINGNILFHSILFDEADEDTLQKHTLDALGAPASHGCVRLTVDDAYWIYWNNKPGAPIEVY